MQGIRNLTYKTDCIFHLHNGAEEERADYHVIRTPSNPSYWFGNLLLFKRAPTAIDFASWMHLHELEFGGSVRHVTFGWDSESQGDTESFTGRGFRLVRGLALRLRDYRPNPRINPTFEVKKISSHAEWEAVLKLQIKVDAEDFKYPEDDGVFRRNQVIAYRRMIAEGCGNWWAAFKDEELVCSLGLFFDSERTIGRFQNVPTAAGFRRQRACLTRLDAAAKDAFANAGVGELVICSSADEANAAKRVYESAGFEAGMRQFGVSIAERGSLSV